MAKKKTALETAQSAYFEQWVRQERIALWLLAIVLITSTIAALVFAFNSPPSIESSIETNLGAIPVPEGDLLNSLNSFLLILPALGGAFILYWTKKLEHVAGLTERLINQNATLLRIMGVVFFFWGIFQLISVGSIVQRLILAPAFITLGLFMLWRSIKIVGYQALETEG